MSAGNAAETVIGAVVLAAAIGFGVFAASSADLSFGQSGGYELDAKFRKADGVSVGTEVRIAGVKVGTVSELTLDPSTYRAVATFVLRDDIDIPEDSDARIESDGLLGGAYVAITPGASDFMLENGDEIFNTQGSISLLDLIVRFGTSVAE
jgi:phospholipid/cholesterol/gamma-HCH transport system substrate-binding protein